MTEAEWLTCDDPEQMFALLSKASSARKWRLFAVACCRRVWAHLGDYRWKDVELAEQLADGHGSVLEAARILQDNCEADIWIPETRACHDVLYLVGWHSSRDSSTGDLTKVRLTTPVDYSCGCAAETAASCAYILVDLKTQCSEQTEEPPASYAERVAQLPLLRDIFGNPFRAVAFSSDWQTDTVRALAALMYESRDFSAMPILADALQDAGCDNPDILNHCRDANQVHVRGCWVVDLVLGKS